VNPVMRQWRGISIDRGHALNVTDVVGREGTLHSLPPLRSSSEINAYL